MRAKRVLVLGVTGMLGHTLFRSLSEVSNLDVYGTLRGHIDGSKLPSDQFSPERLIACVDSHADADLRRAFAQIRPNVVINCIGVVKQLDAANDPIVCIQTNSLLPHRLDCLCEEFDCRLVHISTDCVFTGATGAYSESSVADARDLYGLSKLLGEVHSSPRAVTIRTSIIGPELGSKHGLLEWFLAQESEVHGYTGAIFSGLPTVELSKILERFVIPADDLRGLFHVSADPISKFDLLNLISKTYNKTIDIIPTNTPRIDRSLDSSLFRDRFQWQPDNWSDLVQSMRNFG